MTATAAPKPFRAPPPPPGARPSIRAFEVGSGIVTSPQRVVLYGSGGIGKTTLVSLLTEIGKRPLFLDVESGTGRLAVDRVESKHLQAFADVRAALCSDSLWADHDVVVIDSLSKVEDMAAVHVCEEAGKDKIEDVDGGFGKGYRRLYETILSLLTDLDTHVRAGRDVVLIAHETKASVPNPHGEDFLRYEPRLYQANKHSVREKVKEWADHLLAVLYDVSTKEGKATGHGSRAIYLKELPTHVAKSRDNHAPDERVESMPYDEGDPAIWRYLFQTNNSK